MKTNRLSMTTVLKFGGVSLGNGRGIETCIELIKAHYDKEVRGQVDLPLVVVASARGRATADLLELADRAKRGENYAQELEQFKREQGEPSKADLEGLFDELEQLLYGVSLLHEVSWRTYDAIVSLGEQFSVATIAALLCEQGYEAKAVDSGDFMVTDSHFGAAKVDRECSERRAVAFFEAWPKGVLPIVTGFIARDGRGKRTTLGRNAGNYSATLLANFLNAKMVYNYTHVDGVYTADPNRVKGARKIDELSYTDAAELSQFGAKIIHHLAMEPLKEKHIPCCILDSFDGREVGEKGKGTLITAHPKVRSARAVASISGKALVHFEGRDMLGSVGIDARIFSALGQHKVSVSLVSQGSSERGIAMVVDEGQADVAVEVLRKEFVHDMEEGAITNVYAEKGMAVVALIGVNLSHFDVPYRALVRNAIVPVLLNNAVPGNTVCLLLREEEVTKALNVVHNALFERVRRYHIAVVGHGSVGGQLIEQLLAQRDLLLQRKDIDLCLFAVADSKRVLLDKGGIGEDWEGRLEQVEKSGEVLEKVMAYAKEYHLGNLVAIDNTASKSVPMYYEDLVKAGFDLVSSNKIANTNDYAFYERLRETLGRMGKAYRYETNVGAGLPLIDNLKLLHLSGDRITRIRGLFSGSLSYIFNELSPRVGKARGLEEVLRECAEAHYLEPDPRIDLSGLDVARKVLILARELDYVCELEEVRTESLVPEDLGRLAYEDFEKRVGDLAKHMERLALAPEGKVMRFVGELVANGEGKQPLLSAALQELPNDSPLALTKGADSCFEIYTENYGDLPIVIQGAGAGAKVTAQGVFADLLRIVK